MIVSGRHHLVIIVAVTSAALALLLAISAFAFLTRKKLLKRRKGTYKVLTSNSNVVRLLTMNVEVISLLSSFLSEKKQLGALLYIVNKSKLNYSYEVLENATNYFPDSNKLGQGGSGSVYKVIFLF